MTVIRDNIEGDIRQAIEHISAQLPEDRVKTIKLLIEKYCHLTTAQLMLDKHDFNQIKSIAHNLYLNQHFPKKLGNREISGQEASSLSIMEATIHYLQGAECFRKIPKFDIKD